MKLVFIARALVLATALQVLGASVAIGSEVVYRWKDAQGNQVNSDRPPPEGIEYETISTSSSMVHKVEDENSNTPAKPNPASSNNDQLADIQKPPIEKDPEKCKQAQNNLLQLNSHAQIRVRNDKGEVRFLTEEEKKAEKEKTLDVIEAYCK